MLIPEAVWWSPLPDGAVHCELCPHDCRLPAGRVGPCGTRANVGGRMVAKEYGRIVSTAVDPIEKKPLYHFHPGSSILSIASQGCNLHCRFCQNWEISQRRDAAAAAAAPEEVVALALARRSLGVAYTYSEPLVWYEYVRDTARLVRAAGLRNVIVSNGYLNAEPLRALLPLIDAANIDLKAMDDGFYRKVCGAGLAPVLATIRICRDAGVHLEVTNLVIPGCNDTDEQIGRLVDFLAEVGRDVPLHFSAYRPDWKFNAPPTPPATLARAAALARRKLNYVYVGNVRLRGGADTLCPHCGELCVVREGFTVRVLLRDGAHCPGCGRALPIVVADALRP
ncbi:MAG: AmmeMemoRadiSam system radical SAM enzyme [Candidatus Krumholzibacteriia bacterium]